MSSNDLRAQIEAELERTKFQRKVVSREPFQEAMDDAIAFFTELGYKSGRTGRPNQVFVRGGREGVLPRVNAELLFQANIGKGKVTMISVSGAGEQLSQALAQFADHVRERAKQQRAQERGS